MSHTYCMYLYAVNVSMYVHPSSWYHPSLIQLEFPPPSVALSEDCPHCTWRVLVWSPMPWHRFGWIHRKVTWNLPEGKSSSKNGFFWVPALCFQVLIPSDELPWLVYQHIQRGTSSNGQLCLHRSVGLFVPLKPYRLRVCLDTYSWMVWVWGA